jgi:hypothetical protein
LYGTWPAFTTRMDDLGFLANATNFKISWHYHEPLRQRQSAEEK